MEQTEQQSEPQDPSAPLFPIQRPWLAGMLSALTLGIYLFFYLYVYARDLKRLGVAVRPFLWFLSPLIALSLIFTFPRLGDHYKSLAKARGVDVTHSGSGLGFLVFACFVLGRFADRFPYSGLLYLFVVPLLWFAVARFTGQLNAAKRSFPESYFARPAYATTASTWVSGALALLVGLPIISFLVLSQAMQLQRVSVDPQKIWPVTNGGFTVAAAEAWSVAKIGTYSDGTAVAELSMVDFRSAIFFDQYNENSAAAIAQFRRDSFLGEYSDGSCDQRRWLREGTLEVRSEVICTASFFGDPVVMMSLSINDGERHIEILGDMNSALDTEETAIKKLRRLGDATNLTPDSPADEDPA